MQKNRLIPSYVCPKIWNLSEKIRRGNQDKLKKFFETTPLLRGLATSLIFEIDPSANLKISIFPVSVVTNKKFPFG